MREYYDSVLLVHPNDADLHLRYARYLRDRYEKDYPGAKRQFENVLKIDPTVAVATNEYAYLLWLHFNDTTEANLYFKKAIELAPKVRQFRSDYKFFLNRHVRDEKTRKGYEKALKLADSNNFGMHLDYARFLLKIDWKQEARRHYLKAVALNKNLKNKKDDDLFGIE
jgi:tetratricopeptide (TPR) repeat protein